jgi:N-acetylglutamate synthase-like GNAT family acetyltransferase
MSQPEVATPADFPQIRDLLEAAGLPTSDLDSAQPEFLVIRVGATIVGAGALQISGPVALLRSVVVAAAHRKRGYGEQLVEALERQAARRHIRQLVLLTTTATAFFERAGYRAIERDSAPAALRQTDEFRSLCPSSATCMAKVLAAAT